MRWTCPEGYQINGDQPVIEWAGDGPKWSENALCPTGSNLGSPTIPDNPSDGVCDPSWSIRTCVPINPDDNVDCGNQNDDDDTDLSVCPEDVNYRF